MACFRVQPGPLTGRDSSEEEWGALLLLAGVVRFTQCPVKQGYDGSVQGESACAGVGSEAVLQRGSKAQQQGNSLVTLVISA